MDRFSTRRSPNAAICRYRLISPPDGSQTRRTGPTTRRYSPMRKAPWLRRPPDCISRRALARRLRDRGIGLREVTLHVGAGTFLPVKADDTSGHKMHAEFGTVSPETAAKLNEVRSKGGRIVAVGSTALRLLESAVGKDGRLGSLSGVDLDLHHARLPIPRGRPDADQFPPAALDPVYAGCSLQWARRP